METLTVQRSAALAAGALVALVLQDAYPLLQADSIPAVHNPHRPSPCLIAISCAHSANHARIFPPARMVPRPRAMCDTSLAYTRMMFGDSWSCSIRQVVLGLYFGWLYLRCVVCCVERFLLYVAQHIPRSAQHSTQRMRSHATALSMSARPATPTSFPDT